MNVITLLHRILIHYPSAANKCFRMLNESPMYNNCVMLHAEYVEERMGITITAVWHLIVKDIEDTLDTACDIVLTDTSIDDTTRRLRAEALRDLADICQVRFAPNISHVSSPAMIGSPAALENVNPASTSRTGPGDRVEGLGLTLHIGIPHLLRCDLFCRQQSATITAA